MVLNDKQLDYLKEMINIGIGRSANVLNQIVKNRVILKVPEIHIISVDEIKKRIGYSETDTLSVVSMGFNGNLNGKVELIFPFSSAIKMVDLITGVEYPNNEMDHIRSGTLNEIGNIVLNSLIGTLGNLLHTRFKYSIPLYNEYLGDGIKETYATGNKQIIFAETHFFVKEINIDGSFILYFELDSFEHFFELINASLTN